MIFQRFCDVVVRGSDATRKNQRGWLRTKCLFSILVKGEDHFFEINIFKGSIFVFLILIQGKGPLFFGDLHFRSRFIKTNRNSMTSKHLP